MTTIALRTLQTRVQKSAKQLDETNKDWAKRISLSDFSMQSRTNCVSGQLGLADSDNVERGFFLPFGFEIVHKGKIFDDNNGGWNSPRYNVLTRLWKHQINKRIKV